MRRRKRTLSRRALLKRAAVTGAGVGLPLIVRASALGADGGVAASDRITMGAIGVGGRGTGVMGGFLGSGQVRVLAVCDVYKPHRDRAKGIVDGRYGGKDCAACVDFREITRRDDIDMVLIATPDHWHALTAIDACEHGKDVYCEKPLSLTIREGRAMVEAARRYERVFSGGSQRVYGDYGRLARYVHDGSLGRIEEVWVNVGGPSKPCDLPAEPLLLSFKRRRGSGQLHPGDGKGLLYPMLQILIPQTGPLARSFSGVGRPCFRQGLHQHDLAGKRRQLIGQRKFSGIAAEIQHNIDGCRCDKS